ncbi:hypothetical protein AURANDRAFT_65537 [Aureococcus anophagefferens]|uniref:Methyltransferase FkbM domain-containing protein n=1 Tax=Aureococcus anophagefferens TaxID=44056 RepID=F0YE96_AURAN|nr:hypothetical protein AURANDRAFT_65537 [Aureococcus anophagefferens]EGB06611.1 hypothetical protein AURANDRAFT_65537 [Aureococcus anophagefferens]|eukprot:XP_009038783.1 hypothetical protein AURANDRAFT_65537 [Aureococcus anophagefferens]
MEVPCEMQPPAKKAVVLASLDGRALKLQVGAKTTARKALEAYNKASPVPATGLERKGGAPLRLDAPLGPQVAEGEVVVVVGGAAPAPAPAPAPAAAPAPAVRRRRLAPEPAAPPPDPQLAELLRVAGPETIAARCTPRALARAAFLESTDDDFGRVRAALRARGFACNEELCEQRLSLLLPRSARLLTIGAGFGATCMVADALLDDPTRQVVVDPGSRFQGSTRERNSQLQRLRSRPFSTRRFFPEYHLAARLGRFTTVQGFLGRSRQPTTMVLGDVVDAYHDLAALERLAVRLAGGPFDAVLADCEGAFVDVVRDFPELLDRASWVCVEWDQPSNRNWVAEVRPALLRAGLAPLDCGDRRCACDEPRFAPSFRAQGAPTFHEVFVRTGRFGFWTMLRKLCALSAAAAAFTTPTPQRETTVLRSTSPYPTPYPPVTANYDYARLEPSEVELAAQTAVAALRSSGPIDTATEETAWEAARIAATVAKDNVQAEQALAGMEQDRLAKAATANPHTRGRGNEAFRDDPGQGGAYATRTARPRAAAPPAPASPPAAPPSALPAAPPSGDVHGAAQDPWDSRFAATRTYDRADAYARSADGVEDRLRELAETVANLPASLSRDTTSDADASAQHAPSADGVEDRLRELADTVKNLRASLSGDTTSNEQRRRDPAPVAARSDADEMARRFERLERAVEDAVARRPARAADDGALERRLYAVDAALDAVKRDVGDAVGKQRDAADALAKNVDAQLRDVRRSVDDGRAESARLMEATKSKLSDELRDRRDVRGGHAQDPWDSRFAATRIYDNHHHHHHPRPYLDVPWDPRFDVPRIYDHPRPFGHWGPRYRPTPFGRPFPHGGLPGPHYLPTRREQIVARRGWRPGWSY